MLAPERWRTGVAYNPLAAHMARNPYPFYDRSTTGCAPATPCTTAG